MLRVSVRFDASCDRNRPNFSPKRRCGPTIARVFASRLGMFTALRMVPSSSAARIACAISIPTLSCASAVEAPRCGVRTRLGAPRNGESAGSGSVSKTSNAAAATCPSCKALRTAFSSIKATRFCGKRRVQRDEIRTRKQIVELVHQFDLQAASARRGKIRVVSDHAHPEGNGAPAEFAANPTHSNYAQRFVVELNPFEILFVPMLAANVCVRLWNLARC